MEELARDLGANRQNVQRIVNDLHKEGLVAFEVNSHHRRAQLVTLTEKGRRTFEAAMELQAPWGQRPLYHHHHHHGGFGIYIR